MFLPPSVQWPSALQCDLGAIQLATSRRINNIELLNYVFFFSTELGCTLQECHRMCKALVWRVTEKIHAAGDNAL